jgi:hypothetical protein
MTEMALFGIRQIFTPYDNPKGDAKALRAVRTIKEELICPNEFESPEEARWSCPYQTVPL